jgi:putative restriction endonuclease
MAADLDERIRSAAFAYLEAIGAPESLVTRDQLASFPFEGRVLRLIAAQQGIWKPRFLDAAISILTTYVKPGEKPPYEDRIGEDQYPRYNWRGTDPKLSDNVALRVAMREGRPTL